MRHSSHRGLALLLPALITLSPLSWAQDSSHQIDPDLTPPKNISKLLDPKRLKNKGPNLDIEMMQRLLKFMPANIDPKDVDPEMVQQFLRDNPEFNDPENLKKLRDLAEQQMQKREPPNPNDPNPPVNWQGVQDQLKRIEQVRKDQPVNPVDPRDPLNPIDRPPVAKQPPTEPKTNMPRPKKDDKQSQDFNKWLSKNFGNSPEMKNMAKDFGKIMGDDKKNNGGFLKDIEKEWKSITGSSNKNSGGDNSNLKDLAKRLKLPEGGSGGNGGSNRPPNNNSSFNSGSNNNSSNSSPSSGSNWNFGGGGGGGGSWAPVVVLLLVLVGGVLFYLFYVRHSKTVEEVAVESVRVWPVDPLQVNSREDVVKAFEFLSISKCGDVAMNWHHLQIADRMGINEPSHKDAANLLARLYEKARYAPANEQFDDLDIAEARARFSQLAGAPVA